MEIDNIVFDEFRDKVGVISFIGLANAGKSTLVNSLVGKKVSIVSNKEQTTRQRVMGVRTDADSQLVFIDNPGFFTRKKKRLKINMNGVAI
jgi:GTP-binding protein Era